MSSLTNLAALAIERAKFAQDAMQAEALRTAERLQSALLNSISHQLRTPLAAITGVLTSLSESEKASSKNGKLTLAVREELIDSATQQANTLNRLVENLLSMTRLEAGIIHVNSQAGDVQDLIGAVINQMGEFLASRKVVLEILPDLPAVRLDAVLTGQVLVNLLENACKFSEPGSPIYIAASQQGDEILILVADEGIGLAPADLPHVFDKFYRSKLTNQTAGTGLGLSICKGFIEAQGGRIWAENGPVRGSVFSFALPVYDDLKGEAEQ
ncbi:MAG: ATP-binding protein [Anaerolineales bacterium]|nr:ATP-binding protein [Anaerolineales bacterium]